MLAMDVRAPRLSRRYSLSLTSIAGKPAPTGFFHSSPIQGFLSIQIIQHRSIPMSLPSHVRLVEVGPRDGLQNEAQPISVADKVRLVDALTAAGVSYIEVGSFVSPKWVPQMAGSAEVFAQIQRKPGVAVSYTHLTLPTKA